MARPVQGVLPVTPGPMKSDLSGSGGISGRDHFGCKGSFQVVMVRRAWEGEEGTGRGILIPIGRYEGAYRGVQLRRNPLWAPYVLSVEERATIQIGHTQGSSLRRIARRIKRAPSTISHVLRRNRAA